MSEQTLAYIRRYYKVPAYRGVRVSIHSRGQGVIVKGSDVGAYLCVRLDGQKRVEVYHPTYRITYLLPEVGVEYSPVDGLGVEEEQGKCLSNQ